MMVSPDPGRRHRPGPSPQRAVVSYDLVVGPTNDAVGRTFLLALPLLLPLGMVLLGAAPPLLSRGFGLAAVELGTVSLVLGLASLFSRIAFMPALVHGPRACRLQCGPRPDVSSA